MKHRALIYPRKVFVRRGLKPRRERGSAARRAGARGQITGGGRRTGVPTGIMRGCYVATGSGGCCATRAVSPRRALDHSVRRSDFHVRRCLGRRIRPNLGKPRGSRGRGARRRARR